MQHPQPHTTHTWSNIIWLRSEPHSTRTLKISSYTSIPITRSVQNINHSFKHKNEFFMCSNWILFTIMEWDIQITSRIDTDTENNLLQKHFITTWAETYRINHFFFRRYFQSSSALYLATWQRNSRPTEECPANGKKILQIQCIRNRLIPRLHQIIWYGWNEPGVADIGWDERHTAWHFKELSTLVHKLDSNSM